MATTTEFIQATIDKLSLRPGYRVDHTRNGRGHVIEIIVEDTPSAYGGDDTRRDRYPETLLLTDEDLASEEALTRRIVVGLVVGDLHEHLEFLRVGGEQPWNPHRDPADVTVSLPPYWRAA